MMQQQEDRAVNQVMMTYDYEKFKNMDGNRDLDWLNVYRLEASMKERQYPTPIIVNGAYEIIDGQHRFEACKRCGLPVYYILVEGLDVSDCRILNQNQKEWKISDYLRFYEKSGSESAARILELSQRFKVCADSVVWAAGKDRAIMTDIKNTNGKYDWSSTEIFTQEDYDEALSNLTKGVEIADYLSKTAKIHRISVVKGVVRACKIKDFNYERLKKAVELYGNLYNWRMSGRYVAENLCRIYNRNQRKDFMDVIATRTSYRIICGAEENRWRV